MSYSPMPQPSTASPPTMSNKPGWVLGCFIALLVGLLVAAGVGGFLWYRSKRANRLADYFGRIAPPKGQALRYFVDGEVETLDPHLASSVANAQVVTVLFDGLVEWDREGRTRPSLATRWETNNDATIWTFHLRPGAKWTDGQSITSHDFVYSWKRALSPELNAANAVMLFILKDAEAYQEGKAPDIGVRALDDYTLQVTLIEPAPFFDKMIAHPVFRPVPRQSVSSLGENGWATPEHIITSGAFKLSDWKPKDQLVVERNSLFWDNANTRLDRITFRMPRQDRLGEGVNLYEDGEVDAVSRVASNKAEQLRNKKDFLLSASTATVFLIVNLSVKPLDDVRVRRALSMAIDRQALTANSYGMTKPLTGFVPSLEGYEGAPGAGYDPEQARRLLAEAGYAGGRGFPEIELIYNTAETNLKMAEFVQASLDKELGIKLKLNNQEWRTFLENRFKGKFNGLARGGWVPDYSDAYAYLQLLMTGGELKAGWTDVKYDQMLRQANAELDPMKRATLLRQAETYMLAQQPVIPLSSSSVSFLCKPYVKNLILNPVAQPDWRAIYIDHAVTAESPGS